MCDDDPTLATPVAERRVLTAEGDDAPRGGGVALATAVITPVAVATKSREASDPDTARSAVAMLSDLAARHSDADDMRVLAVGPMEASPVAPPPPVERPVIPLPPLGPPVGVIPDLREGIRRVDLHLHDNSFVAVRVRGVDPLLVGRAVGLLLGPLGLIVGDALGRRAALRARVRRLAQPRDLERDPGERIPLDQVVAVTAQRLPWGGRVHIGAGGGAARTLRWSRRDTDANHVAGLLQAVGGRRFSLVLPPNLLGLAHRAAMALLVLAAVATIALPMKALVFPPAPAGAELPAAAREALTNACPTWRAAPLSGPLLVRAAGQVKADFATAASAGAPELAHLTADIAAVEGFAPKAGKPNAPLVEAAAFSAAVDRIDAACARVGL
ncbi:MAG TPA: hypothetical protein VF230_18065 [Acidimicrobiales bacterium]